MPTYGPNSPGTTGTAALAGNSDSWNNATNIAASDGSTAFCVLGSGGWSNYLSASNFGFSVATGETVDGILIEWQRNADTVNTVKDRSVRVLQGGTAVGSDLASASGWPSAAAYASYGGSSSLWGTTWLRTDINATGFGALLAAEGNPPGGGIPRVDHVRITVYTSSGGGGNRRRRFLICAGG